MADPLPKFPEHTYFAGFGHFQVLAQAGVPSVTVIVKDDDGNQLHVNMTVNGADTLAHSIKAAVEFACSPPPRKAAEPPKGTIHTPASPQTQGGTALLNS